VSTSEQGGTTKGGGKTRRRPFEEKGQRGPGSDRIKKKKEGSLRQSLLSQEKSGSDTPPEVLGGIKAVNKKSRGCNFRRSLIAKGRSPKNGPLKKQRTL